MPNQKMISFHPIGTFHGSRRHSYDAPRQPGVDADSAADIDVDAGEVRLFPGLGLESAVRDLEGFSRIWLLFVFHLNSNWKPMVRPPRGDRKVGVLASRSPHRPNPIGLTCVRLESIQGLVLSVRGHDILDGSPILDIKPYLSYADSFPDATGGWTEGLADSPEEQPWPVSLSPEASAQAQWLAAHDVPCVEDFLRRELTYRPLDASRKRVSPREDGGWILAYRTWRILFRADMELRRVSVDGVASGYSPLELDSTEDPYLDKSVHRAFTTEFPSSLRGLCN